MIIRTPSAALRARIRAAGETGPLDIVTVHHRGVEVARIDGPELSEPEQRRVAGLVAADDAEPFT